MAPNAQNDTQLLTRLRAGDHAAFNTLYKQYWTILYRSAYSVLRNSVACDDLVQEIFVWLWANRERHLTDNIQPYLRAAVKYKVANLIRHGKVKETFYTRTVTSYQEAAADENTYELQELKAIIAAFTESLPERAKYIFRLSREQHLTNREIAERLNISEKTVENQMNISLKKLKVTLDKLSFWSVFL
jgi:RNA polymerase sigma-70 factor (family 1)